MTEGWLRLATEQARLSPACRWERMSLNGCQWPLVTWMCSTLPLFFFVWAQQIYGVMQVGNELDWMSVTWMWSTLKYHKSFTSQRSLPPLSVRLPVIKLPQAKVRFSDMKLHDFLHAQFGYVWILVSHAIGTAGKASLPMNEETDSFLYSQQGLLHLGQGMYAKPTLPKIMVQAKW